MITGLADGSWTGPSSESMVSAVAPYLQWTRTVAVQCEEAATRAIAAAAAYETAFAMTVPPPAIVANRVRLARLIATNFLGQNTPAIAVTEAEYSEMWAQDATAMYNYAVSAASASAVNVFTSPPQTTNPSGLAAQAGAIVQTAGAEAVSKVQTTLARLISSVPQDLQSLASPGTVASLGSSGVSGPISALSSLTSTSGKGATKGASAGMGTLSGLSANRASVLGGIRAAWPARSAWAPMWLAWAPMVQASVPTPVDLVSTRTACRWISRAPVRFWAPKGPQAWDRCRAWTVAHRRGWVSGLAG